MGAVLIAMTDKQTSWSLTSAAYPAFQRDLHLGATNEPKLGWIRASTTMGPRHSRTSTLGSLSLY